MLIQQELTEDALYPMRVKAWDHLDEIGFPTRQTEVYRYIKLNKLYEKEWNTDSRKIIDVESQESVVVIPLTEAITTYGAYFQNRFAKSLKEETDAFAILNAACHQDGLFIYVPPNTIVDRPLRINYALDEGLNMPRLHLFVGTNAKVDVVLRHCPHPESFLNSVIDCNIEENARVNFIQYANNHLGHAFEAFRASLKRNSFCNTVSVTNGSACVRNDYRVALMQEGAEAHLNGVCHLKECREAHVNILMEHLAPNCRSRQLFKSVLDDFSRTSFEGKIFVKKEAQQTDAFQLNNNLLLSERSQAYSKPNLEIFADDVKASHGATVGQLDEDQLFYMRTRGIDQNRAKKLLTESFCQEILDIVEEVDASC